MTNGFTASACSNSIALIGLRRDTLECLSRDLGLACREDVVTVMVATRQGNLLHGLTEGANVFAKIRHEGESRSPLEVPLAETEKLLKEVEEEDKGYLRPKTQGSQFYVGAIYRSQGKMSARQCTYCIPENGPGGPVHKDVTCVFG